MYLCTSCPTVIAVGTASGLLIRNRIPSDALIASAFVRYCFLVPMRSPGIELEILPQIVLHGDSDSGQAGRFESALFYLHSVMAGADVGEAVEAAASSCNLALQTAICVNQPDCSVGNHSACWISNRTIDRAGFRLTVCGRESSRGKQENNWENDCARPGPPSHNVPPKLCF